MPSTQHTVSLRDYSNSCKHANMVVSKILLLLQQQLQKSHSNATSLLCHNCWSTIQRHNEPTLRRNRLTIVAFDITARSSRVILFTEKSCILVCIWNTTSSKTRVVKPLSLHSEDIYQYSSIAPRSTRRIKCFARDSGLYTFSISFHKNVCYNLSCQFKTYVVNFLCLRVCIISVLFPCFSFILVLFCEAYYHQFRLPSGPVVNKDLIHVM